MLNNWCPYGSENCQFCHKEACAEASIAHMEMSTAKMHTELRTAKNLHEPVLPILQAGVLTAADMTGKRRPA